MTSPCISVVVPAYNAEEHLRECLDSVLAQSEVGEVVIVDDGSSDGTRALAEDLADEDLRVSVLHQENAGVSVARNKGMVKASYPWLAFVDADDIIPDGSFGALLETAERYGADMTYGNFSVLRDGKIVSWPDEFAAFAPGVIPARNIVASLANTGRNTVSGSCWRVLFRASFVKRTRQQFPEGIAMSEDYCFILGCLMKDPTVAYVDHTVYLVRREGGSATQCYMPDLERSMDFVNGRLRRACEGDGLLMDRYWECVANTAIAACSNLFKEGTPLGSSERRNEVRRIIRKYREAIGRISLSGGLGRSRSLALKVGAACPWVLWAALEAKDRSGSSRGRQAE